MKKIVTRATDKNAFVHKDSGPEAAQGFNKDIVDPKNKKITKKENHYEPEKFSAALEKTDAKNINNYMSKSIFDKLYEDVMKDDAADLGISTGPEGEAADKTDLDLSGGSEDTVTVTLDKDTAQKLHDALVGVLEAGVESETEGESETGGEDLGDELKSEDEESKDKKHDKDEDEEIAGEATDIQELPDHTAQLKATKGQANVVKGTVTGSAKAGKGGDGTVKDGIDGKGTDHGHALVGSGIKGGAPTSPKGKANVVSGVIKGGGKGDQSFYQSN